MNDNHLSLIPVTGVEKRYSAPQTWGRERERLVTHRDCYFAVYVTVEAESLTVFILFIFSLSNKKLGLLATPDFFVLLPLNISH